MRNIAHEAGYRALDEKKEGRQCIMVLMPKGWGAIAFDMGSWPKGVWPRFSNLHSSLKSLPIETLIIVGKNHDKEGVSFALERLRAQANRRVVIIQIGDPEPLVFDGDECNEQILEHIG